MAEKGNDQATQALKSEPVITRIFETPREMVWKAWTEREQVTRS